MMSIGTAAVWYFACKRIVAGDPNDSLTLGDLLAFVGYIWLFYDPMQWFTSALNWTTRAFSGAERIFSLMEAREEVYDDPGAISLPKIRGKVCFKEVRFSYEEAPK